jgi:hypothetical protein
VTSRGANCIELVRLSTGNTKRLKASAGSWKRIEHFDHLLHNQTSDAVSNESDGFLWQRQQPLALILRIQRTSLDGRISAKSLQSDSAKLRIVAILSLQSDLIASTRYPKVKTLVFAMSFGRNSSGQNLLETASYQSEYGPSVKPWTKTMLGKRELGFCRHCACALLMD